MSKLNRVIFIISFALITITNANSCLSKKFSMKITSDVNLIEAIEQLSDMCNFSIVITDNHAKSMLHDNSSINIKQMDLNQIFDIILSEKNLHYDFNGNVLKISSLKSKTFKIDYITSIREGRATTKASVDSSPVEVGENQTNTQNQTNSLNQDNIIQTIEKFDFWEKLDAELKAILNNTSDAIEAPDPIINQNAGLITVTGTPSQLKRVKSYITHVQQRLKRQVVIDVSIISVELANEYKKGIDWSKFQLGFNTYLNSDQTSPSNLITSRTNSGGWQNSLTISANLNLSIDGVINFLETNGKTKVVSSPKITTLNNQQALISVGDNINYRVMEQTDSGSALSDRRTTTYKQYSVFIGILLNLLPEISDDNKIMLRVNPSLSNFKYRDDDSTTQNLAIREIAPDTLQKKLSTVVYVNSGDTIILGGLIGQTKAKDNTRVPLLADIPLIGAAFKSTKDVVRTTELVFVITPRVVDLQDIRPTKQSLKDLGFSKSIYE
ncbi:Type 3 secretion system secretin [Campylobacter majalis]|uniref:Type 3 secretion system secretin n=1 Tax=Campylobacter majalis TaxID=2790656 RepID=A0ABM8Q1P8_9BACT|nr:pilus (MSHA type) biogenesis protein MshL [Campylobacter majalis]CAD7286734.1 Type 3 secretion system secretin [Campylobacter majalis]